jgi:hypothetical protein
MWCCLPDAGGFRRRGHGVGRATGAVVRRVDPCRSAGRGWQTTTRRKAYAAVRWKRFGVVPEQAFALLGEGRCLVALDRPTEAAAPLRRAREIFGSLGATPALAETNALLQRTTALSS